MDIIFLGTGTATPVLERNASGLLVQTKETRCLVDIGPGTLRRLCEAGIDHRTIDAVIVTHFHPDHVSDLAPFLFAANYAYGPRRDSAFRLIGPPGTEQFVRGLVELFGDWIIPSRDRLVVKEWRGNANRAIEVGDVRVTGTPAVHHGPALSYRIEAEGVSVTVSGDTDFSPGLMELAASTDVLICECSFPDSMKVPGHLTPSEAGAMAAAANAGRLVLTHFYPPCESEDVVLHARSKFPGEVIRAHDLMRMAVP